MTEKRIVYVQGTWDLFHVGHVNILHRAHKLSRRLIVGVNTNKSIKKHKGSFPVISYRDRVKVLKACKYVDKVVKSDLTFSVRKLKRRNVEVIVLGSDWKDKYLAGIYEAKKENIEILYFPYTQGISSTDIKRRIRG